MHPQGIMAVLLFLAVLGAETQGRAQWASEEEQGLPVPTQPSEPLLLSPPFDPREPEYARGVVLRMRNWFLASASVFGVGWILLGTGIGQCQEFGSLDACSGRGDRLSRAGMTMVFVGSLAIICTLPWYGARIKQERELERLTLDYLTYGGRIPTPISFDEYQLADAKDRSRRARNALIGTTATLGVGTVFLGFAIPRCEGSEGRLLCSDSGYFHFTAGITLVGTGALGAIVSGALLGTRNRKRKSLEDSARQRKGAGLRWDPVLGALVF
jgi:hypothetical protein